MAGVTLRLGVQTATRNRSVACDDCRFIVTKEYTMAHPMVSSELQNSKMRLAAISVQNLCDNLRDLRETISVFNKKRRHTVTSLLIYIPSPGAERNRSSACDVSAK